MKKIFIISFIAICTFFLGKMNGADQSIGFVNFKLCLEKSQQGQHEKNAFESLRKQMLDALEKTDTELEEMAKKLEDQDYMDGLSPTAEEDLKQKFQIMNQDYARYQNQFSQLLSQANYKMLQTLHDGVSTAAEKVRETKKLALILSEDSTFAHISSLDYTQDVIDQMNKQFAQENATAVAQE